MFQICYAAVLTQKLKSKYKNETPSTKGIVCLLQQTNFIVAEVNKFCGRQFNCKSLSVCVKCYSSVHLMRLASVRAKGNVAPLQV